LLIPGRARRLGVTLCPLQVLVSDAMETVFRGSELRLLHPANGIDWLTPSPRDPCVLCEFSIFFNGALPMLLCALISFVDAKMAAYLFTSLKAWIGMTSFSPPPLFFVTDKETIRRMIMTNTLINLVHLILLASNLLLKSNVYTPESRPMSLHHAGREVRRNHLD